MTELEQIAATFGVSEPVFKIKVDSRGDLEFDVKSEYRPAPQTDPVAVLVAMQYSEHLNKEKRCFEKTVNIEGAYNRMINSIRQVTMNTLPLKNPKQSKLYKWLCECDPKYHNPTSVGFIALYRYIVSNSILETRDNTNPYAKNVIAVLELMREKHENKASSN